MYAALEIEMLSGPTATLIKAEELLWVLAEFKLEPFGKCDEVGLGGGAGIVCNPTIVDVERDVNTTAIGIYLIEEARVVVARFEMLYTNELMTCGLESDSTCVGLT